jgi:hypothetical protein
MQKAFRKSALDTLSVSGRKIKLLNKKALQDIVDREKIGL